MDYVALRTHMDTDTDARGYSAMADQQAADDFNILRNDRVRASMLGEEILNATDASELGALAAADKTVWLSLCAINQVDPSNTGPMVAIAQGIGSFSQTVINLKTARNETVSDTIKYGFGSRIIIGDVQNARAL